MINSFFSRQSKFMNLLLLNRLVLERKWILNSWFSNYTFKSAI